MSQNGAQLPKSSCQTAQRLSAATLDEHEGDTMHEHQFVNVLSPSCPSELA
jgi:hypothetical protein